MPGPILVVRARHVRETDVGLVAAVYGTICVRFHDVTYALYTIVAS